MKVWIDCDEAYPTYFAEEAWEVGAAPIVTVEKGQWARWCAAIAAYNEAQSEMSKLYWQARL